MLCAISGEAPQHPVASRKSGNVYERRLIETYISENGTDPVNGDELSTDDLIDLKQSRVVKPRPPTLTSIPALLSTFQNEWDALILETFQLKQQLSETRQELSTALYYNDSAQRVIARLQKERDEARDALSRVSVTGGTNGVNGDAMQVDGQPLSEEVVAKITETQERLSATRRKRPVPEDWATADELQTFDVKASVDTQFSGAKSLASDSTGDFFLCGDSDGTMGIFDLQQGAFTTRSNLGAGAILGGAWCNDKQAVSTSSGVVAVSQEGAVQAKFQQHAGAATAVACHPSGQVLVSVGYDKSYIVYDLSNMKVATQVFTDIELTTVAFHPDGHLLAVGGADGSVRLYDIKTSQPAHTFPAPSANTPIVALTFSENGTWLASSNQGQNILTVWDLRKLNALKTIDIGTAVSGICWDYTGQFLAACGPGGVVVSQYSKSGKSWSEPLRKALNAADVKWGARAKSLVALTSEGAVAVLGA
ncbi:cell cycle control [Lecanosticta acicola]|uniref:Pre-mRNA-processing factor 19 n=1 Tax=Lecanosticta acicola TaxID=111012 RepID=A0AAI9E809_9PEZI|nr:cell cycle control [Lecanosticta acicola]